MSVDDDDMMSDVKAITEVVMLRLRLRLRWWVPSID